jgi:hypothetical protein
LAHRICERRVHNCWNYGIRIAATVMTLQAKIGNLDAKLNARSDFRPRIRRYEACDRRLKRGAR